MCNIYKIIMIQINNISFSKKNIESNQIDNEDVKGVEVELQKTNFKITIIKNSNETIKEEINDNDYTYEEPMEEQQEPEPEEEEEPEEEGPKEEQPESEPEPEPEPEDKTITLEAFKEFLEETIEKKNTCKTYYRTVIDLYKYFNSNGMKDLLSKEKDIIKYLEKEYKTTSTLKNKLCGIYKCYTLLNIESTLSKDKIESYNITQAIIADKVLDYFKDKLKEMKKT